MKLFPVQKICDKTLLSLHSEMEIINDLELCATPCISSGWNFESQACHIIEMSRVILDDMFLGTGKFWAPRTLFTHANSAYQSTSHSLLILALKHSCKRILICELFVFSCESTS